jgi:hypothetical protein
VVKGARAYWCTLGDEKANVYLHWGFAPVYFLPKARIIERVPPSESNGLCQEQLSSRLRSSVGMLHQAPGFSPQNDIEGQPALLPLCSLPEAGVDRTESRRCVMR